MFGDNVSKQTRNTTVYQNLTTVLVSVKSKQTIHLILTLGLAKGTLVLLTGKSWSTSSFVCSTFVFHLPGIY